MYTTYYLCDALYEGTNLITRMLLKGCFLNDLEIITIAILGGADVNFKIKKFANKTPLHLLCALGNVQGVRHLLSKGANPNNLDDMQTTPSIIALHGYTLFQTRNYYDISMIFLAPLLQLHTTTPMPAQPQQ